MSPSAVTPRGSHEDGGNYQHDGYRISSRVHSDLEKVRVICIGAGASGLCLAYKMKKHLANYELICYEKNKSIGGTWFENRYPGCACDIPAHNYTFSFEPNPSWSTFYAYAPEIEQYFRGFSDKYGLSDYIQLSSRVISATWDEQEGTYDVEIETQEGVEHDYCHVLINASEVLNNWKWPKIPGLDTFEGPLLHSANWDPLVTYNGKKVAVLGTGSSAIQIVPNIQPKVSELISFMRSPTWISPAVAADFVAALPNGVVNPEAERIINPLSAGQHYFSSDEIKKFKENPEYHLDFRKKIENVMNNSTDAFVAGSEMNDAARKLMTTEMEKRIGPGHDYLKKKLIPTWPPGCRRLTPGDGYLEALVQPNVKRVFEEIDEVTPKGLITSDGQLHEVDIIICATGFNVAFMPSFCLRGLHGEVIQEQWAKEPNCYLGLAAPHFPNYFSILGPRGPWGNGPLLPSIETLCDYFVTVIEKMQKEQIRAMEVRMEPTVQFNDHVDEWMRKSVWKTDCRSWYKMGTVDGKVWLWPGGTLLYLKTIKNPRYEDFHLRYKRKNQWAFLGNGKTAPEILNQYEQLSPYIRNADTAWTI